MRLIRILAVFSALLLGTESAKATPLALLVDPDGSTYLYNTTPNPISFDGYQLASETLRLDPVGWKSIADYVAGGQITDVIAALGAGGLAFGEANPGPGNLAELNLGGAGILQGGAKFYIGKPFLDSYPNAYVDFFYKIAGDPSSITGDFVEIPEPSSWLLASMAGLGLLAARRFR